MWRRAWCSALLMAAGAGCGSGKGAAPSDGGGGSGGSGGGHDGAVADVPGGTDAPPDGTGFEPFVPDYFDGGCSFFGGAGEVPAEGSPFHGLTVVATGLKEMIGLEVDATNAYLASASSISRLPLAGGAAQVMVMNAMPIGMAIDDSNVYWSDAGVSGQTTIQSVPLTATNATTTTTLAQKPGAPGAFTMIA